MGWFAITCVIGFLGFLARPKATDRSQILMAACILVFALIGLGIGAYLAGYAHTFGDSLDFIGEGYSARAILGLVLGAGAAFILEERARPPSTILGPDGERVSKQPAGLPTHLILSTGLGITILAVAAPHVDSWLTHLTGIKSPVLEFQISSTTTHKIAITDYVGNYQDFYSLYLLGSYAERLPQDLEYARKFAGNEDPDKSPMARYADELGPAMEKIISPVAGCVQKAIDRGLSVDGARDMLRRAVQLLEEIIFSEDILRQDNKLNEKHEEFWKEIIAIPKRVATFYRDRRCSNIPSQYDFDGVIPNYFPKIQDYSKAPYLYVAASLFISFMGDDEKALHVLSKAEPNLAFKDYSFLWIKGRLSFFQGKPGDPSSTYFGPLDEMRAKAHDRINTLIRDYQSCTTDKDLLCREQEAEVLAINTMTSYLAEDVARNSSYAIPYTARLQEYAEKLKLLMDKVDGRKIGSDAFSNYLEEDRYTIGDSYAFALLATEAQKPTPNYDFLRNTVVPELQKDVEHVEDQLKNENDDDPSQKLDQLQLKLSRSHYAAALGLIGE